MSANMVNLTNLKGSVNGLPAKPREKHKAGRLKLFLGNAILDLLCKGRKFYQCLCGFPQILQFPPVRFFAVCVIVYLGTLKQTPRVGPTTKLNRNKLW